MFSPSLATLALTVTGSMSTQSAAKVELCHCKSRVKCQGAGTRSRSKGPVTWPGLFAKIHNL